MQTFKNSRIPFDNRTGSQNTSRTQNMSGTRQPTIFQPIAPFKLEHFSITELRIYQMLRLLFVLIPLVAGVDKFFYSITDWDRYVPTVLTGMHVQAHSVMVVAGVIEIVIACIVAINPRVGSLAAIMMLGGIILDLLSLPAELHIVLLDGCLCVSALCLFLLASRKAMLDRFNKLPG